MMFISRQCTEHWAISRNSFDCHFGKAIILTDLSLYTNGWPIMIILAKFKYVLHSRCQYVHYLRQMGCSITIPPEKCLSNSRSNNNCNDKAGLECPNGNCSIWELHTKRIGTSYSHNCPHKQKSNHWLRNLQNPSGEIVCRDERRHRVVSLVLFRGQLICICAIWHHHLCAAKGNRIQISHRFSTQLHAPFIPMYLHHCPTSRNPPLNQCQHEEADTRSHHRTHTLRYPSHEPKVIARCEMEVG